MAPPCKRSISYEIAGLAPLLCSHLQSLAQSGGPVPGRWSMCTWERSRKSRHLSSSAFELCRLIGQYDESLAQLQRKRKAFPSSVDCSISVAKGTDTAAVVDNRVDINMNVEDATKPLSDCSHGWFSLQGSPLAQHAKMYRLPGMLVLCPLMASWLLDSCPSDLDCAACQFRPWTLATCLLMTSFCKTGLSMKASLVVCCLD